MRRLRVLGALVAASMASRQPWTSVTAASNILQSGEAEELDKAEDIAAIGALSVRAGPAGDPAFERFGDPAIKALGARADLWGEMASEDRRERALVESASG